MKKATLMNQMRKARQAGDREGEARLREQLAQYQAGRKARRGRRRTYRVKRGDNYFSIAKDVYGDARYVVKLAKANKGLYQLSQGMVLQLPPKDEEVPWITPEEWETYTSTNQLAADRPETTADSEIPVKAELPKQTRPKQLRGKDKMDENAVAEAPALVRLPESETGRSLLASYEPNTNTAPILEYPVINTTGLNLKSGKPEDVQEWVDKHPDEVRMVLQEVIDEMKEKGLLQPLTDTAPRYGDQPQQAYAGEMGGVGSAPVVEEEDGGEPEPIPNPPPVSMPNVGNTDNPPPLSGGNNIPLIGTIEEQVHRDVPDLNGIWQAVEVISPDEEFSWNEDYWVKYPLKGADEEGEINLKNIEVPSILVASGVSVQAEGYNPVTDKPNKFIEKYHENPDESAGYGPAQISNVQMTRYGFEGEDQTDPEIAKEAMAVRIATALAACPNCDPADKIIIAAMAQNGDFITPKDLAILNKGEYNTSSDEIPGNIDWQEYFIKYLRPSLNADIYIGYQARGEHYDSQFMVKVFVQDMLELNRQGWPLPYDLTKDDLVTIKDYMENITVNAEEKNE